MVALLPGQTSCDISTAGISDGKDSSSVVPSHLPPQVIHPSESTPVDDCTSWTTKRHQGSVTSSTSATHDTMTHDKEAVGPPHNRVRASNTMGVRQMWVHARHRRQRIALRLVECARRVYSVHTRHMISREEVAFSQPTSDGLAFARNYQTSQTFVWTYGIV